MTVFERIVYARKQREITQKTVAGWLGITDASYGRKERGKEGGMGPAEIEMLIERLQVDARFIFGQVDSWEQADLTNPNRENVDRKVLEAIDARLGATNGDKELQKLIERLRVNGKLREHTERLALEPGDLIEKVDAFARYLLAEGLESLQREPAAESRAV